MLAPFLRLRESMSTPGLLLGALFFAASLTPSLLPRTFVMQGILSGASFAAGYGIGVAFRSLWGYLEIPVPRREVDRILKGIAAAICLGTVLLFLWQASEWQNSVRLLMNLPPVDTAHPTRVGIIALLVFAALIVLARLFGRTYRFLSGRLNRYVPPRVSKVAGAVLAVALFWSLINGVIFEAALRLADSAFAEVDQRIEANVRSPSDPLKTGSTDSLISWETLGFRGRQFVASGPTGGEIARFFGTAAEEPLRVYVGLTSRESVEERAELALAEMLRVGAFERSVLVVVVPTGTGWVDPAALDTLEYLHRGDVASVALQYSYLSSWLSLMVEPGYGAEAGRALFERVYTHWTSLPEDARPRLYLHGLSLGAMNSELSTDLYDVVADPFDGALWSGPPFPSRNWRQATLERDPGSPSWLPRFRDGSIIRFSNQENPPRRFEAPWGPIRIVYLQYASDPVSFFDPYAVWREPSWMRGERGPDVSPALRWFPVVTVLQLAFDMAVATTAPIGYGHVYAPSDYIDAWLEVTEPPRLDPGTVERLKILHGARF